MFYRSRKLYGFIVETISRPGVLAAVTLRVAERGLDITYCSTRAVRAGEMGVILLFVDFTGSDVDPESLAEKLEALEFVEKVEVIRPRVEGFIADEVSFPLTVNSARAVIMDEMALKGLFVSFRERLGTGGEAMLYYLGLETGKEWGGYLNEMAESVGARSIKEKANIAAAIFTSLGLGQLEIVELMDDPPFMLIRIYRSIECWLGEGAGRTFSQFIRGTINGVAGVLFGREMFARETRCIARGDPYCEFEVTLKNK
jgi:predicted hydrocarbon binding protein